MEFELGEAEDDADQLSVMRCFRIMNNKRAGDYAEASVFLPDDILSSLRGQRGLVYSLLRKLTQSSKAMVEKLVMGGASKIELGKSVASDVLTFAGVEEGEKLVKEAAELLLLMAEYLVEHKGGLGGLAATQHWKECITRLMDLPTSKANAALKARAAQVHQTLASNK